MGSHHTAARPPYRYKLRRGAAEVSTVPSSPHGACALNFVCLLLSLTPGLVGAQELLYPAPMTLSGFNAAREHLPHGHTLCVCPAAAAQATPPSPHALSDLASRLPALSASLFPVRVEYVEHALGLGSVSCASVTWTGALVLLTVTSAPGGGAVLDTRTACPHVRAELGADPAGWASDVFGPNFELWHDAPGIGTSSGGGVRDAGGANGLL